MSISLNSYRNQNHTHAFGAKIPVKVFGDVSPEFVKEMKTSLNLYPRPILNQIQKANLLDDIRLAPKYSDTLPEFPELKEQMTKELVHGWLLTKDEVVNANSMTVTTTDGNKTEFLKFISFHDFKFGKPDKGQMAHELTHKVDEITENATGVKISETRSFKEAAGRDLDKLPERLKSYPKLHKNWSNWCINYTTQKSTPKNLNPYGLSEIFAECGAANITGTSQEINSKSRFMDVFFPESYKYVQKFFYLLGKR